MEGLGSQKLNMEKYEYNYFVYCYRMSRVFKKGKNNQAPIFINKLYEMVEDQSHSDIISWTTTGQAFAIKSITRFTQEILPIYFKHRNFASFIRQLNMYGFKKIRHNEGQNVYMNDNFKANSKHLLKNINRKIKEEKQEQLEVYTNNRNNEVSVSRQIQQLRNNQKNLEELCRHFIEQNQRLLEENHSIVKRMEEDQRQKDRKLQELLVFLLTQKDNKGITDNPPEKMLSLTNGGHGDQPGSHSLPQYTHSYPSAKKYSAESPLEAIGNAMDHNSHLQKARQMIQNIYGRKKGKTENNFDSSYQKKMTEPEGREPSKDHNSTDAIFGRQFKSVSMLQEPEDNFLSINDFLNVDDDARNHFDLESSY